MGNGFPVGGVLIHESISAKFGMLGTTFGGNHLACVATLAVLEVLEKENLIQNAEELGRYFNEKAKEILRKHPDIKGFQTSAGNDVLGVGRAIEEAGLTGKVCLVGTGLPNPSAAYLDSGAITAIGFWDPQKAGMAMNEVARILLDGGELTDGMDLGVEGYNAVSVRQGAGEGKLVVGNGMVIVDKDTYKERLF